MKPNPCGGRLRRPHITALTAALALALGATALPTAAHAVPLTLHTEAAPAFWLSSPQSDRFKPGFYFAVRPGLSLGRVVGLQWSYALLTAPAGEGFDETGATHALSAGVRVRPLATLGPREDQLGGLFTDFNVGYVRTGPLDRLGLDAGLGYNFQVAKTVALGPVVRYTHVFQPNNLPGKDITDARVLSVGLNLSFGSIPKDAPADATPQRCPEVAPCPDCPEPAACPTVASLVDPTCADRDGDGVCDVNDRCPTEIGPASSFGCPLDPCTGVPLSVLVQFQQNSATLPPPRDDDPQTMDPVLESIAKAMAQDPSCRVCVIGYASEEGTDRRNEELSLERSSAVKRYLGARGLESKRILTTGMGARCQVVPETSRALNRRVEFRRLEDGEACPTTCAP